MLSLALFSSISITAFTQDVKYTQVYSNPLKLNPASMGMNQDLKFILHYRTQWSGIQKGYTTYSFTTLYPIYIKDGKEKLDLGINAMNDKAGAFSSLDFSLSLGYNLRLSKAGFLNFAVSAGYIQKSISTAGLTFDQQYVLGNYSASNPNNEALMSQKVAYPDISFGTMWYYNPLRTEGTKLNAYVGASAFHLNQPNESLTASLGVLPMRYSFQGGIKILGDNKIDFTPNVIFSSQGGNNNSAAGLLTDYHMNDISKVTLGIWYRNNDAIAFSVAFDHKTFSFGYSYDVVNSKISNYIPGLNAHEITLAAKINQAAKKGVEGNPSLF